MAAKIVVAARFCIRRNHNCALTSQGCTLQLPTLAAHSPHGRDAQRVESAQKSHPEAATHSRLVEDTHPPTSEAVSGESNRPFRPLPRMPHGYAHKVSFRPLAGHLLLEWILGEFCHGYFSRNLHPKSSCCFSAKEATAGSTRGWPQDPAVRSRNSPEALFQWNGKHTEMSAFTIHEEERMNTDSSSEYK
ncbi:hypothetical protein ACRRTK_013949 [Alexandromys fortis]